MQSKAATPEEYIASLPEDRKKIIKDIRAKLLENLPEGFTEEMGYGMLNYVVPHSLYPNGYHCDPRQPLPFIGLASQKNYISFYHMGIYEGVLLEWFKAQWPAYSSKKPDMGKGCIRFRKAEDVPLDLIGELATKLTVHDWIAVYEKRSEKSASC